ncbi:efflux RND transporter periplasmic adaptor subunit [Bradyrhizobium sp.]|jgi:cobalt-zinc-cadmium efflux system membrane fusion protein|uniref:efflux RND transporter periplasmic adaptor subunit n=1 Tax=Bradyrhizobium sp. TaxID=376 RepID=UPI002C24153E|nr:efflux RND transporter periplasmic adaptor subunit [Bradyrhizobium sp.]HWX60722.1 efflux RND transporter periplasmic adaptor subunit [Bradyrhizobium sp.]
MDTKASSRTLQWCLFALAAAGWGLLALERAPRLPRLIDGTASAIGGRANANPAPSVGRDRARAIQRDGAAIVVPDHSPYRSRVAVQPVEIRTMRTSRIFPASVEADVARTVNVLPPLAGRVTELKIQLGDEVRKGQRLTVIESGDLAQAISDAEKAKAQAELTLGTLQRAQNMTKFGGIAIKDLEQAQSDYAQAKSELDRASYRLQVIDARAEVSGDRTLTMTAPIDGTITVLATAPGSYVNDTTQSLMTIANLERVFITANVPENDLAFVAKGEDVDVSLRAFPGQTFAGKVDTVSRVLDADTRRTKVRVVLDNPDGKLRPNMFATVELFASAARKLVVPTSALLINNDDVSIFVEVGPWRFERRVVTTEAEINDSIVVTSGLKDGDRIVTRGGVLLND